MSVVVYDLPTRLLHWFLAIGLVFAYVIAEFVDDESPWFALHSLIGLGLGPVLFLRVFWGFYGTRFARFRSFLIHPRALYDYFVGIVQKRRETYPGHNPASAVAAILIWLSLGLTILSGILMALRIKKYWWEEVHEIATQALVVLVALHLAGLLLHQLLYKDSLPLSMWHGRKQAVTEVHPPIRAQRLIAISMLVILMGWGFTLYSAYNTDSGRLELFGRRIKLGEAWR